MDIRPLYDRVVLKRDERQRHSPGGILIPDTAGEKPTQGRVMAVGKGKNLDNGKVRPIDLRAGDRGLPWKYNSTGVKVAGEEHIVARVEDNIVGINEPAAERPN